MNLKVKIKLQTFVCAPCYNWIVWRSLVRFLLNRQCIGKSRVFRLGASLYYLVGETALSWGGPWVILSLGQWRVRVQPQGVAGVTTGVLWALGGFSPAGGNWIPLFRFPPNYSGCETVRDTDPNTVFAGVFNFHRPDSIEWNRVSIIMLVL